MEKLYKIAIDTKGSDKGPEMMIKGAAMALEKFPSLAVCLVGDEELIRRECEALGIMGERVEIINAPNEITNYDSPATALFEKRDSSLVVALEAVAARDDTYESFSFLYHSASSNRSGPTPHRGHS